MSGMHDQRPRHVPSFGTSRVVADQCVRTATWWHDDGSTWDPPEPATPTVYDEEPNPVIGILLGPHGQPVLEVRAQPHRPMGFQPPGDR